MIKKARIDLQGNITVQKFLSRHELNMVKKRNMQYCAAQLRQDIAQIKKYLAKKSKIASSATYYAAHKEEYAAYYAAHKEEYAAYYAAHKEEISKTKAAYYAAHKEEYAAYYAAHKEEISKTKAAYYAAHKEEYAAYRAAHKEEISKTKAAYYAAHKETPEYKLAHGQKQCANCSAWARLRKAYVNGQSVFLCNACIGLG
jgi:hypothetical protein